MVCCKQDHKYYFSEDIGDNFQTMFFFARCIALWFRGSETLPMYSFLYTLRKYEYYLNIRSNIFNSIKKQYWRFVFRHKQLKYNLFIEPNVLGSGTKLIHPGYRKIPKFVRIGKNCTILPMVLIGKKKPGIEGCISIGDNCYISTGVTILGPVKIGDNVTIGAGAVVTKDIPNNSVVVGVPAKII